MKRDKCLPLEFLKRIKNKYPYAFEQMEIFHKENGTNGLPAWESWCYAPLSAAIACVTADIEHEDKDKLFTRMLDANAVSSLAVWRRSKEVFVIDPAIEELLSEQMDESIPSDVLMQIPYPGFYVECNDLLAYDKKYDGFFVHLEHDPKNNSVELRLLMLADDYEIVPIPIHIDENNITKNIARVLKEGKKNVWDSSSAKRYEEVLELSPFEEQYQIQVKLLQIVLYLCSQNAEIELNQRQATITRRPTDPTKIKDRFAEIRKWDVGVRYGSAFRQYQKKIESGNIVSDGNHRASPRPHMRRGHFRHTLIGKRNVPFEERKYALRWIAPTLVGKSDEESPVVIHDVN